MSGGFTQDGLPFSGNTPLSRQHSYLSAKAEAPTRASKTARYLELLSSGPISDEAAAEALGCKHSTICSTRNKLVELGQVEAAGSTESPVTHRKVTTWRKR